MEMGHRSGEPVRVHWLGQVIEGVHLKGPESITVEGGDKHDRRQRIDVLEARQQVEAIVRRHLYIEKNNLWPGGGHQLHRGLDVARLPHDDNFGMLLQAITEIPSQQRFVIDQNCAERLGRECQAGGIHAVPETGSETCALTAVAVRSNVSSA